MGLGRSVCHWWIASAECDEVIGSYRGSLRGVGLLSFGGAFEDSQELAKGWEGCDDDTDILFDTGASLTQSGRIRRQLH